MAKHVVNLLAAQLAKQRFGIPDVYAAMPDEASQSMLRMLDDLGVELLFGRQVDLAEWDVAVGHRTVVDLSYELANPEEIMRSALSSTNRSTLSSLPLVVRFEHAVDVFSPSRSVREGDQILALGKAPDERGASRERI